MVRRSPILLVALLAGCGGGGGLLATVPPPVEFAGARVAGLNELPPAGTYTGTVTVDQVEYEYNGRWDLVDSTPVSSSSGEVVVGSDGSVTLRQGSVAFTGVAKVSSNPLEPVPTVALTAPDGTKATYPYSLRKTDETLLTVVVHGKVQGAGTVHQRFTRYTFEVTLVTNG